MVAGAPSEPMTASLALQYPINSKPSVPYAYDSADSDDQSMSDLKALLEEQQRDLNKDLLHLVAGSREKSKARVKSKLPSRQEPASIIQARHEDSNSIQQRSLKSKHSEKVAEAKQSHSASMSQGQPEMLIKENSITSNRFEANRSPQVSVQESQFDGQFTPAQLLQIQQLLQQQSHHKEEEKEESSPSRPTFPPQTEPESAV